MGELVLERLTILGFGETVSELVALAVDRSYADTLQLHLAPLSQRTMTESHLRHSFLQAE